MRLFILGLGASALMLLLHGQATAQATDAARPSGNPFTRLFAKPSAPEPPSAKPETDAKPDSSAAPSGGLSPAAQLLIAKTTLFRRQAVCNKLREVALQVGDDDLMRQANLFDERAWEAYQKELARLSRSRTGLSPEEQALERHLGAGSATLPTSLPTSAVRRAAGTTARRMP